MLSLLLFLQPLRPRISFKCMKPLHRYFHMDWWYYLFSIKFKLFILLKSYIWCKNSHKTSSTVLSLGTIYLVWSFNFWVCGWNPMVYWTIHIKPRQQYFWRFVDTILWCDHSRCKSTSSAVLSNGTIYCQRGNLAKKRGCLGGRFIMPQTVSKTRPRNPLKFAVFDHIWVWVRPHIQAVTSWSSIYNSWSEIGWSSVDRLFKRT